MNIQIVSIVGFIVGIMFMITSFYFKRKNRAKIIREIKKEKMEMDTPGFLSLLSDQLQENNMTTAIKVILDSPVASNNSVVKEIKHVYIRFFRSGRSDKLNDITDVVKYATINKYKESSLLGLLYATVKLGNELDKEILKIINNIEELSYNIVNFIINIKKTMSATVSTTNTIINYLVPVINAVAPVIFAVIQKQVRNISESMGAISGFSGSSTSIVGLKPLPLDPSIFALILAFEIIVVGYLMTKIKFQMMGSVSKYNERVDALMTIGRSLLLYSILLFGFSKMFSGLL